MSAPELIDRSAEFQSALINWYDRAARELPWRREPSLYKTVVSEFMLQQTQVKTALPYFHAWMTRYPDFQTLAAASEEEVLKSWEGLGYYSRARNLRKLAQEIAPLAEQDIPREARRWLDYPGIGPYAAAAVCSISFGDASAVVDGNVVRILSRLTANATAYKNGGEAAKVYQSLATALLNRERPGDHNQAMMELGATVCHKQSPRCLLCPARSLCAGHQQGIAETLPRLDKTKFESQSVDRAWSRSDQGILLHKIPAQAKRMRGLHEIPSIQQLGLASPGASCVLERKRSITRYRITERFFEIDPSQLPSPLPEDHFWVSPKAIPELAFSGPHRRWIEELLARKSGPSNGGES